MSNPKDTLIHPTALVHPKAQLGTGVKVGAFSIVGESVRIDDFTEVQDHVCIQGNTEIGKAVRIFPFVVIGAEPQHLHYKQEPTQVRIGDKTIIRENVTIHRGTAQGTGVTSIGIGTYLMAYVHVAHDCEVGSNAIICNAVQLAGHVSVGDFANIGGLTGVAQFCRVGKFCYVGGASMIRKDLPPFLMGKGNDFEVQGINSVGLSRQGFESPTIGQLKNLYKIFYLQNLTASQAIERASTEMGDIPEVREFIDFIKNSKQGFVR